jgi:hypothetical protein
MSRDSDLEQGAAWLQTSSENFWKFPIYYMTSPLRIHFLLLNLMKYRVLPVLFCTLSVLTSYTPLGAGKHLSTETGLLLLLL